MHLTPEQYHRFINGQCSEEEREQWIAYFRNHPEQLEEYMDVEAWNRFNSDEVLHPAVSGRMLHTIRNGLRKKHRFKGSMKLLAAAVCIGIISLVIHQGSGKPRVIPEKVTVVWYSIVNTGDTIRSFVLNDQSVVELYPGSVLKYQNTRDVYLSGEAKFNIKKKTHQPFTVFAAGIATTALGTAFKVTALPGKKVQVKLFSGKVVIRPVNQSQAWKEIYLKPGENFILEKNKYIVKPVAKNPPVKHTTIAPLNVFENTPLAEVLKRLKNTYNIQIRFNEADLREVFVTATFDQHDTPESILETLCTLNRLQLTKDKDEYKISR